MTRVKVTRPESGSDRFSIEFTGIDGRSLNFIIMASSTGAKLRLWDNETSSDIWSISQLAA